MPTGHHDVTEPSTANARRWFSPYSQYEYRERTRRSKAPLPTVLPRYVLLDETDTLRRLFARYVDGVEVVAVPDAEGALAALRQSPAQALVVNSLPGSDTMALLTKPGGLPFSTPAVACWVPGGDELARQLGILRYLVKPVTQDVLLSRLKELGEGVKQILLVDDEQEVLRLFTRMLSSTGRYRTLWATNGQQALDLLRERHPDVMLLDLIMPGMDGFQVLQEKRGDPSIHDIPVLVVSSRDPQGDPIVSSTLTITRSGGLSVRDILACVQAVSTALLPLAAPGGRE